MSSGNTLLLGNTQESHINFFNSSYSKTDVNFVLGVPYDAHDKGLFLFSLLINNVGIALVLCGFRRYDFEVGTYTFGMYTNAPLYKLISSEFPGGTYNARPMIQVPKNINDNVVIRFMDVPNYSMINAIDTGGYIIKNVYNNGS